MVLSQALQIEFNRFANVRLGFGTRVPLGYASRKRRTGRDKHAVLVLLQVDTVEHAKDILASRERRGSAFSYKSQANNRSQSRISGIYPYGACSRWP